MVKICQTGLLKLNFETRPKKRISRFLPKISAGHGWSWKFFFANFQILGPLGCQGWVVIPQNVKKVKITAPYTLQYAMYIIIFCALMHWCKWPLRENAQKICLISDRTAWDSVLLNLVSTCRKVPFKIVQNKNTQQHIQPTYWAFFPYRHMEIQQHLNIERTVIPHCPPLLYVVIAVSGSSLCLLPVFYKKV